MRERPLRHRWDYHAERRFASSEFPDGNARNIRCCAICEMRKITVIPPHGFPWHEWQMPNGDVWRCEHTPPCRGGTVVLREQHR